MATKAKPTPGHKLQGVAYGVSTTCECGWRSAVWLGKGARGQAYGEWHNHVARCIREGLKS